MGYYVSVDENGRISGISANTPIGKEPMMFDFPKDFGFDRLHEYVLSKGKLVHDPLPEPDPEPDRVDQLETRVEELEQENTATMVALVEVYEMMLAGGM